MNRREYRRKMDYLRGYRRGYQEKGLLPNSLQVQSAEFKRGYFEGRKDFRTGEPPIY